jgi:hypothetical protein
VEFNDLDDASFSMPTPKKEIISAPFSRFDAMDPVVPDREDDPIVSPQRPRGTDEDSNEISREPQPESSAEKPDSPSTPTAPAAAPLGGESEGRVRITHEVERIAVRIFFILYLPM